MAFKITVLVLVLALLLTSFDVGASRELHWEAPPARIRACGSQVCAETCVDNGYCGGICD
uniref:Uncharacterized protein n=1 Tax=Triticum urartu TaxID=4572 RepID=A0A8R7UB41_TRIUA